MIRTSHRDYVKRDCTTIVIKNASVFFSRLAGPEAAILEWYSRMVMGVCQVRGSGGMAS